MAQEYRRWWSRDLRTGVTSKNLPRSSSPQCVFTRRATPQFEESTMDLARYVVEAVVREGRGYREVADSGIQ